MVREEIIVVLVVMGSAMLIDWACLVLEGRAEKREKEMRREREENKRDKD